MNITEKLDLAIKFAETGTTDGSYAIGNIKRTTYMSNEEWNLFLNTMDLVARAEYKSGGGKANLDGFLETPDKYIFVEAKFHES